MQITDDAHARVTEGAPRWRLGFPADGSAIFELTAGFDDGAARALGGRIAELVAHEQLGLVLDLSAAGELDGAQLTALLGVVGSEPPSPLVVVTPSAGALERRLARAGEQRRLLPVPTRDRARPVLRAALALQEGPDAARPGPSAARPAAAA